MLNFCCPFLSVCRDSELVGKNSLVPSGTRKIEEPINPSSVEGTHSVNDHGPGLHTSSSSGQNMHNGYSNSQGVEDYNQLVNRYYELEEQRQKVLQQLYQFGGWNYQGSDSSIQWGAFSASQEHQVPVAQTSCQTDPTMKLNTSCFQQYQVPVAETSNPTVPCSCRSNVCPRTGCSYCVACTDKLCKDTSSRGHNGKSFSVNEDDLIKTAMGAADKALSSLKTKASGGSDTSEGESGYP